MLHAHIPRLPLHGTEWPILRWCAVKKLLTHLPLEAYWISRSWVKGQGRMSIWCFLCAWYAAATRGQYLALSKAWWSCFVRWRQLSSSLYRCMKQAAAIVGVQAVSVTWWSVWLIGRSSGGVRELHERQRRRFAITSSLYVTSSSSSSSTVTAAASVEPRSNQLHQQTADWTREGIPLQQVPHACQADRNSLSTRPQRNTG